MGRTTTVRISAEDKERLEKVRRRMGKKTLSETMRALLEMGERESDIFKADTRLILSTLQYARDIGETNASKIDEYLYGEAE